MMARTLSAVAERERERRESEPEEAAFFRRPGELGREARPERAKRGGAATGSERIESCGGEGRQPVAALREVRRRRRGQRGESD